jgi:hypothetical protein
MGRYVSQPLTVECKSIADIQKFLRTCKYVSDEEQFGKRDYWQAPEQFEKTRRGDCDCFALWTWRQFLNLGYEARLVVGKSGRYGQGHAWVQFSKEGKWFLIEPAIARIGCTMPRLNTLRYEPTFSVAWDGNSVSFYQHEQPKSDPPFLQMATLIRAWLIFWTWVWTIVLIRLPFKILRPSGSPHNPLLR